MHTGIIGRRRELPLDVARSSTLVVMKLGVIVGVLLVSAVAVADEDYEAQLDHSLAHPAPLAGLDRAHVGPPRWCGQMKDHEDGWAGSIVNSMSDYRGGHFSQSRLIESARYACNAPNRPAAQRASAEILQYWINETGLSEADAIASIAARVDHDAFDASRDQLCKQLDADDANDDDNGYDSGSSVSASRRRASPVAAATPSS